MYRLASLALPFAVLAGAFAPSVVPAGAPSVVPAGAPSVVPAGAPAVVPAGTPAIAPATATSTEVTIDNFAFSPQTLTVTRGTRVQWTNRDDIPHTVTDAANPGATRSAPLDTGETYARVFDKPGQYRYFCSLHPHMQGTVVVR